MVLISYAPDAWKLLNGVICVYKPAGVSVHALRNAILGSLCRDLNQMKCRPPTSYVKIEGNASGLLTVTSTPSYADHPLVIGPRYQPQDIRFMTSHILGKDVSGVLAIGINKGTILAQKIYDAKYLKTFHVKGQFGYATDTSFIDGKTVEKATFSHIQRVYIDRLLASIQSSHKNLMFQCAGVDPQSQTAYELASQGPIRPVSKYPTIIYNIKCIDFKPPDFILELQCFNERALYLKTLIHDIGLKMKSVATCTQIRCIRFGFFTLDQALLRKHWTVEHILNNIIQCRDLLERNGITPKSPLLQEPQSLKDASRTVGT